MQITELPVKAWSSLSPYSVGTNVLHSRVRDFNVPNPSNWDFKRQIKHHWTICTWLLITKRCGEDSPLCPSAVLTDVFTDEQELGSVYKPRQRQNLFQAAAHLRADKGWGGGGGCLCPAVEEVMWPPSSWSSKNTFRAESRDAWLFIYPLISLPPPHHPFWEKR